MINVIIVLVILVFVAFGIRGIIKRSKGVSCCGGGDGEIAIQPADKNKKNYPFSAILKIDGMKCAHCAFKIQNALNCLDGVYASVKYKTASAEVLFKDESVSDKIKKAVFDSGYAVSDFSRKKST